VTEVGIGQEAKLDEVKDKRKFENGPEIGRNIKS
jgi:hypothetical protein